MTRTKYLAIGWLLALLLSAACLTAFALGSKRREFFWLLPYPVRPGAVGRFLRVAFSEQPLVALALSAPCVMALLSVISLAKWITEAPPV